MRKPSHLGRIASVSGASAGVALLPTVASGIVLIGGKSYAVGQVGSFVKIPQGYHDLYGIVVEAGADPTIGGEANTGWIRIQLVGESVAGSFERGISRYPSIGDEVHLVTESDLQTIYPAGEGLLPIGRLSSTEAVRVAIDLDRLVTRHSAILGSTGSGKSTTVASLLRTIVNQAPSARVLLIDVHGEYSRALRDVAQVLRVGGGERDQLFIPYWALDTDELLSLVFGKLDEKARAALSDKIFELKLAALQTAPKDGVDPLRLTADTPVPFSLRKLWSDLIDAELRTWADVERTIPAVQEAGDPVTLRPPKYSPPGPGSKPPFTNSGVLGIRKQLELLRSRMLDRSLDFFFQPGPWTPELNGTTEADLPELLASWIGHEKPITILDVSGVPSSVLMSLVGSILRIVYDALFWARDKSEGGTERPQLIVLEEAHRYLGPNSDNLAQKTVQRIVKEGRKFGIGAMLVSQRPAEIDETILSQCGTFFALRLANGADRARVQAALPDALSNLADSLPVLRTGETFVVGEAARLPMRCRIDLPDTDKRPSSEDPPVFERWRNARREEAYPRVGASWRAQNPRWRATPVARTPISEVSMERTSVNSSNLVSVGYDNAAEILEVEFKGGNVYQYYNVPENVYRGLMDAASKGGYLHSNVRKIYPYSQV